MQTALVDDELWELIQPLLPRRTRRYRHPGRMRLDDRCVLNGILFVLTTGIAWQRLPGELGFGSGMTCWRRLKEWHQTGVFQALHVKRPRFRGHLSAWPVWVGLEDGVHGKAEGVSAAVSGRVSS